MKKKLVRLSLIALAMFSLAVTTAMSQAVDDNGLFGDESGLPDGPSWMLAQDFPDDSAMPPMGGPGFPPPDPSKFDAQRKHLEQFRMYEMLKLLDLEDDQEVIFLTAFRQMRDEQSDFEKEKMALIEKLRDDIDSGTVTREKIDRVTDDMANLHKRRTESMEKFFATMKQTLTPEQMAKFIVFEERFEFELLKKLRGFHERRGSGKQGPGR